MGPASPRVTICPAGRNLKSDDVNAYLEEITHDDFSAKDFRTRASYIDPRIIDRYCDGLTIAAALAEDADRGDQHTPTEPALEDRVEHAVLDLIAGNDDWEVVEELPDAA